MTLIETQDLYKSYDLGEIQVPVLKGVSLAVERGEFVAIMGASGSGKSTLMNILGCLDHPTAGKYFLGGKEVSTLTPDERAGLRNKEIGFVFQNFNLLRRTSALENVLMPFSYGAHQLSDYEERERALSLLSKLGLGDRIHHEPSQLSGGQQQRVAVARALINNPSIVFADEPTGNLDSVTSEEILNMFRQLNKEEGITVLLVTHDPGIAHHADRTIHIRDGIIVDCKDSHTRGFN